MMLITMTARAHHKTLSWYCKKNVPPCYNKNIESLLFFAAANLTQCIPLVKTNFENCGLKFVNT